MTELYDLLAGALAGDAAALETYLTANSNLPGARMNTKTVNLFAEAVGACVAQPDPPVTALERLLDAWAALPLGTAPVNTPREILPACAVMSYGKVALLRPDWWQDEVAKLHWAASDPRWRTREIVAAALQCMLAADWPRAVAVLNGWVVDSDPLVVRAAVAAIAEPPLLKDVARGLDALALQQKGVLWLSAHPTRDDERIQVLRQALGFTISVAVAAAPDAGFAWLAEVAASPDSDLRRIVRENLKKARLAKWSEQVARVRVALGDG